MICSKCGSEIQEGSNFCNVCGSLQKKENDIKKCSKCGFEFDEKIDICFCPNCGKKVERKNTFMDQGKKVMNLNTKKKGIVVCILFLVLSYILYFKIYPGKFDIKQSVDTIELGRNQDLLKTVEVNYSNIKDIAITDDGGFDANKVGDYSVIFDVFNNRQNHCEKTYVYHVVDTTAPTISVDNTVLYAKKGSEINLNSYINMEDKSGTATAIIDGDYNINVANTYQVEIHAEDESGNKSETIEVTLVVEDRDHCDFRCANFGETKEIIKRYETEELEYDEDDMISYKVTFCGVDGVLIYSFNEEGKLAAAGYLLGEDIINYDLYISYFEDINEILEKKYGKADSVQSFNNSYGNLSLGNALVLGDYAKQCEWYEDNMTIRLLLQSEEWNEIVFNCMYYSNEYYKEKEQDFSTY